MENLVRTSRNVSCDFPLKVLIKERAQSRMSKELWNEINEEAMLQRDNVSRAFSHKIHNFKST